MALRDQNTYGPLGTTTDEILAHENDDRKTDVLPALLWRLSQKIEKQGRAFNSLTSSCVFTTTPTCCVVS
jgi:hypothetical protein